MKTLPVLYDKEKGYRKSDRKRGVWIETKRKQRELAALLAVALLAGSAACGADAGEKDAAAGQGTDAQAGAQENMEETALSLMREVNPAEAAGTDDLYRSWYEVFVYSFYDGDGDGIGRSSGTDGEAGLYQ